MEKIKIFKKNLPSAIDQRVLSKYKLIFMESAIDRHNEETFK